MPDSWMIVNETSAVPGSEFSSSSLNIDVYGYDETAPWISVSGALGDSINSCESGYMPDVSDVAVSTIAANETLIGSDAIAYIVGAANAQTVPDYAGNLTVRTFVPNEMQADENADFTHWNVSCDLETEKLWVTNGDQTTISTPVVMTVQSPSEPLTNGELDEDGLNDLDSSTFLNSSSGLYLRQTAGNFMTQSQDAPTVDGQVLSWQFEPDQILGVGGTIAAEGELKGALFGSHAATFTSGNLSSKLQLALVLVGVLVSSAIEFGVLAVHALVRTVRPRTLHLPAKPRRIRRTG